jgi:PEP-CTERM motif
MLLSRTGVLVVFGWAAAAVLGAGAASAAPITVDSENTAAQKVTVPMTTTNWGPSNFAEGVNPLSFTKFDPKLGKLEAVNIGLNYSVDQAISMEFKNASTITVNVSGTKIQLERPDQSVLATAPIPDYSATQTYAGPDFPHTLSLPAHTTTGSVAPMVLNSAADLALFTQSSPSDTLIKLPTSAVAQSSFTASTGNAGGGASVSAGAVVSLTYTYEPTPVPEPSTFAAFALGLGGYLMARRHRRGTSAAG